MEQVSNGMLKYGFLQGEVIPFRHHYHPLNTCADGGNAAELWLERKIEGLNHEI